MNRHNLTTPAQLVRERLPVNSVTDFVNWAPFGVTNLREDAAVGDGSGTNRGASGGVEASARFRFDAPSSGVSGTQAFRVRVSCSVSGGAVGAKLYESGVLKRDLGTRSLSGTSPQTLSWAWQASDVSNPTNAELVLTLFCNLSSGYYTIDAIDWHTNTDVPAGGSGGGGSGSSGGGSYNWPSGWGPPPPLGSHHGIGQAFNFAYNGQGQLVWQPLRDYNDWLGRPANIVKVWCALNNTAAGNWDGVAGGAGTSYTTWGGQLNELNPNRAFDPTYWPVTAPIVFALTAVPYSHQNYQPGGTGAWTRPGIWQEIASGTYDVYYQRLFRRIATKCGATGRDPATVVIRWCWEANGNWYPHSVGPDKANFIAAWRRCMDIMRSSVSDVLGAGKSFMIEFGPSGHLRFGSWSSERLWNIYPGDDWVDICGLGIHDQIGIASDADFDRYLRYPASIAGTTFEGILDWFDFAVSRNKWVGTSEIESNYTNRTYFPKTQNMNAMWTNGFEAKVRQRYAGKFLYFIYLWNGDSALKRADGWGEPYRLLYKP
jgi:hypothetical protein